MKAYNIHGKLLKPQVKGKVNIAQHPRKFERYHYLRIGSWKATELAQTPTEHSILFTTIRSIKGEITEPMQIFLMKNKN